ncbi:DUF4199 domain-containing protein [Pararhodonellum marinum]|uniref:DUF4199 domain-containing protein n=1 Tax=Pararhodonellum marinum TaxID=2755358 RepID=UPI001890942F|nr:DUF4199 domain-containing protein [Pararhodonellum marinum]
MENQTTTGDVVKKWGLIYGLIGLIVVILGAVLNLGSGSTSGTILSSIINITIAFLMFYFATKEYVNDNGVMSFGKGYGIAILVALLGGLIRSVGFYLYIKFVDTTYLDKMLEASEEMQERLGGAPDPDQVPEFVKMFQTAEFISFSTLFSALFAGLILGAVAAAINKKTEDFDY